MTLTHFAGNMLRDEYERRAAAPSDIQGHLPFLREQAARFDDGMILELGVRSANSTAALLLGAAKAGGFLVSVDIVCPTFPQWWCELGFWELLIGDDMSAEILARTPQAIDLLFIDTSHAYEHTLAELRTYVPRVRPGGIVLLHDVELEVVPELPGPQPPFPVAKAVETFCRETGRTWVTHSGSYGLGVLEV